MVCLEKEVYILIKFVTGY